MKKAGKASKKAAKKAAPKSPKKAAKKAAKKPAKKSAKKSANKTTKSRAVTSQETTPVVPAAPVAKRAKPATPRAKPAPAAKPAAAAERNTYFITTAIAYPNGIPHIGHAYEAIATDALARFQRLDGKDVFFLTGTDEHGLKMVQTAESEGMGVAELAARNAVRFKDMDERAERVVRPLHPYHGAARTISSVPGGLEPDAAERRHLSSTPMPAGIRCATRPITTKRKPSVGEDDVRRGPQGSPVEWVEEKSYFFKLSAYQDKLLALYESQPDFIGAGLAPQRSHRASSRAA